MCCGSGSEIWEPVPFLPLDPGSGMGKNPGSGSGMNNPDHISDSLKTIFWFKILKFFDADPGWKKFGSGMEKFRSVIRDKHPGSATLPETFNNIVFFYLHVKILLLHQFCFSFKAS